MDRTEIVMGYCGTVEMEADGLTNGLAIGKHIGFVRMRMLEYFNVSDFKSVCVLFLVWGTHVFSRICPRGSVGGSHILGLGMCMSAGMTGGHAP